jgi:predicted ArsR family transcriptional regulator
VFAILAERGSAKLEDVAEYMAVPQEAVRELFDELLQRRLALADAGGRQVFVLA